MEFLKHLTEGAITEVQKGVINIGNLLETVEIIEGARVLIIGTKSRFLRVFPVSEDEVWMVRICMSLEGFSEIGRQIFSEIKTRGISLVHSTGFCPIKDECFWEGYFSIGNRDKIEEFTAWLRSLESIIEVESSQLTIEE